MTKTKGKKHRQRPRVLHLPAYWRHPQRHTTFKSSCSHYLSQLGLPSLGYARSYVASGYGFDLQRWVYALGGWELSLLVPEVHQYD